MRAWAAGARGRRRCGGWIVVVALLGLGAAPVALAASPDWVESGGRSARHPPDAWVTGYGQARGREAEARARQAAMTALAQAIEVRVEFELEDDRSGGGEGYDEHVAALTRTSSDVELRDVRFETWRGDRRVHVLAVLERASAGAHRRQQRDRALARAEACLADAELAEEAGDRAGAERRLAACRAAHAQAIRHDVVSDALGASAGPARHDDDTPARIERIGASLDRVERATEGAPARSLAEAADRIADQLTGQGLARPRRLDLVPLVDARSDLPSPFGQAAALEIERALAAGWNAGPSLTRAPRRVEITGAHRESEGGMRLTVVAREFGTGTLLASGASVVPTASLPQGLALRPDNWAEALEQRRRLEPADATQGASEAIRVSPGTTRVSPPEATDSAPVAAPLRVELWTDRGRERVSYGEGESIRVFVRVSAPAWVRLVYVLSNGLTVPIEDAMHIDADRAQTAIALSSRLEVVAPFGVEMLHVAAYRDRPPPLETRHTRISGEPYEVVEGGVESLVRLRGVRIAPGDDMAEDVVTVTTLASTTGSEWRVREAD